MPEEASIAFYQVGHCGYYAAGSDQPSFCDMASTLADLHDWLRRDNRPVDATATFQVEEDSDLQPVFCLGMHRDRRSIDFLATTWNETPSTDGQTASVRRNSPVGAPAVDLTAVPDGGIPGYATYFWLIPDQRLLATIRFGHLHNGHAGLCKYMNGFLEKYSSHVVAHEPEHDDIGSEIDGYRRNANSPLENLWPRFRSTLLRRPAQLERIRRKRADIRKTIQKDQIQVTARNKRAFFQRMMAALGVGNRLDPPHDMKFKYEIDFTPTDAELEAIIQKWEEDHDERWDDVGFVITGVAEPLWLSHSFAKTKLDLNVRRVNAELVDSESLLAEIRGVRDELLALARHNP